LAPDFDQRKSNRSIYRQVSVMDEQTMSAQIQESWSLPETMVDGITERLRQAIITGTSTFRLDKLALYLSDRGPQRYFGSEYSEDDARRFADALLQELLGHYTPPDAAYETQEQYVAAALSANRSRADAIYLSHLNEIGIMWGTLVAVRAYTRGESFVARNVGLRSVWDGGHWRVKIIFMDHDSLIIPSFSEKDFYVPEALRWMMLDETYIWGRGSVLGTVGHLREIYRITDELHEQTIALARSALKKLTRRRRAHSQAIQSCEHYLTRYL